MSVPIVLIDHNRPSSLDDEAEQTRGVYVNDGQGQTSGDIEGMKAGNLEQ